MLLSQGCRVGGSGRVTFLPPDTELWPLLCMEQPHALSWSNNVFVVPMFGYCSWTAATTFGSTIPVEWWLVIIVFSGMLTTRGPAWLKNIVKSCFLLFFSRLHITLRCRQDVKLHETTTLLWNPGRRTTGLSPASSIHTIFACFDGMP